MRSSAGSAGKSRVVSAVSLGGDRASRRRASTALLAPSSPIPVPLPLSLHRHKQRSASSSSPHWVCDGGVHREALRPLQAADEPPRHRLALRLVGFVLVLESALRVGAGCHPGTGSPQQEQRVGGPARWVLRRTLGQIAGAWPW